MMHCDKCHVEVKGAPASSIGRKHQGCGKRKKGDHSERANVGRWAIGAAPKKEQVAA